MEEFLKFASSEQSTRSKAFMFIWRILIAVILTNKYMNCNDYYFSYTDLSFKEMIEFIFSIQFIVAASMYLIMIFVFFWLIRFLGIFLSIIFSCFSSVNERSLNGYFRFYVTNQRGISYFKNRKSLEYVQDLAEQCKQIYNPIFEFTESRLNVLLANSFLIHTLKEELQKHELYSWWLGAVFGLSKR
jgi:hypothetical protein